MAIKPLHSHSVRSMNNYDYISTFTQTRVTVFSSFITRTVTLITPVYMLCYVFLYMTQAFLNIPTMLFLIEGTPTYKNSAIVQEFDNEIVNIWVLNWLHMYASYISYTE